MAKNGKNSNYKSSLPLVIHPSINSKIYDFYQDKKSNRSLLAMGLYIYLYDSARRQNNNRVWLTDSFIRQGTGISKSMLLNIKKDLVAMELIEIHHERKNHGMFGKRFIEIKFVWKKPALDRLFYQEDSSVTEYKISKALLTCTFAPYQEMGSKDYFYFDTKLNGVDVKLQADIFYFNDEYKLIAAAEVVNSDGKMDYTIPSIRIKEVIEFLASSYGYRLSAVLRALQAKP